MIKMSQEQKFCDFFFTISDYCFLKQTQIVKFLRKLDLLIMLKLIGKEVNVNKYGTINGTIFWD